MKEKGSRVQDKFCFIPRLHLERAVCGFSTLCIVARGPIQPKFDMVNSEQPSAGIRRRKRKEAKAEIYLSGELVR